VRYNTKSDKIIGLLILNILCSQLDAHFGLFTWSYLWDKKVASSHVSHTPRSSVAHDQQFWVNLTIMVMRIPSSILTIEASKDLSAVKSLFAVDKLINLSFSLAIYFKFTWICKWSYSIYLNQKRWWLVNPWQILHNHDQSLNSISFVIIASTTHQHHKYNCFFYELYHQIWQNSR
jgi:hypothetical protein